MTINLPRYGHWHLSNNVFADDPPFAVLKVNFQSMTGSVRSFKTETRLQGIRVTRTDQFTALYNMRADQGLIDANYEMDQTLSI